MYINIKIYVIYHNIKILYSIIVHCIVLFYAIIERNLIKRVFYGNARGLSERRMSPKVKFMKRSYEINPYCSTLNDRISDKDKFSYNYKSKYAITESNLLKGVDTIAGFNPRYKY